MSDPIEDPKGDDTFNEIREIAIQSPNTPIAPATGIAAIALNVEAALNLPPDEDGEKSEAAPETGGDIQA